MSKSKFTAANVTRAVKGATAAGLDIGSVRIQPDGTIIITPLHVASAPDSELDSWMTRHARSP